MSAEVVTMLTDSLALGEAAAEAGITMAQARAFCAALAEMRAAEMVRVIGASSVIERRARDRAEGKAGR